MCMTFSLRKYVLNRANRDLPGVQNFGTRHSDERLFSRNPFLDYLRGIWPHFDIVPLLGFNGLSTAAFVILSSVVSGFCPPSVQVLPDGLPAGAGHHRLHTAGRAAAPQRAAAVRGRRDCGRAEGPAEETAGRGRQGGEGRPQAGWGERRFLLFAICVCEFGKYPMLWHN